MLLRPRQALNAMRDVFKHIFSIEFDNLQGCDNQLFAYPQEKVLAYEIRINGILVETIGGGKYVSSHVSQQYLVETFKFSFDHGSTPWGWHEDFSLDMWYGPLPKEILLNLEDEIQSYGELSLRSLQYSPIHFARIQFRETSMEWGDNLHFIAWKAICENREGRAMTEEELKIIRDDSSWLSPSPALQ